MYKVLTIAGSDCSGGAGIQADLKTISAHNMYGMSVITALTAQNTTGVFEVIEISPQFVGAQLEAVFNDIFPDSVKIGMVANIEIIDIIIDKLNRYQAKNIVVDPVMIATSGNNLINNNSVSSLITKLLPIADIITPNIPEAETIANMTIDSKEEMIKAAQIISKIVHCPILIKGGHLNNCADDLLYVNSTINWFENQRINNDNTHGTGCTLSSAIACNLAANNDIFESVAKSKAYITKAIASQLNLGKGRGPINHNVTPPTYNSN